MSFREGLLQARGQIVFILALTISTGVIIWLEALDTEQRIQGRVQEALLQGAPRASGPLADRAEAALRRAEEAYARDSRASESRAALLTAQAAAVQLGLRRAEDLRSRTEEVLAGIEADRTPATPGLAAALTAAGAVMPALRERIARLPAG